MTMMVDQPLLRAEATHDDEEPAGEPGETTSETPEATPKWQCAGYRRTDEDTGMKLCTYKAPKKWYGPCPRCHRTFACLQIRRGRGASKEMTLGAETMERHKPMTYVSTGIRELDRVLGGGIVYGKLLLLAAPAGSGKTTLLLQAAAGFAKGGRKAYFASGEMDGNTNVDYAKRLGIENPDITLFCDPGGVDVDDLFDRVLDRRAKLLLVDSLQVCTIADVKGDLGNPTMMDAAINMFSSFVQEKRRAAIVITHINKVGDMAGTEKVRHLCDGIIRLDYHASEYDELGKPVGIAAGVRKIHMDGKSRQGRADLSALVELTDQGIGPLSRAAMLELSKLAP